MSTNILNVGIIGADTKASWAGASHVPAIRANPKLTLAAVATRHQESAKKAAEAFGAAKWYADPYALIEDKTIDIVTVAVKVPAHRELVLAALKAGKAVYCESPLGVDMNETLEMAKASQGLHTAIGLQGRYNPSVKRAMEIVSEGKLGRILSANVFATTFGFGPQSPSAYDYFNKSASGASFLTITAAHVLDIVESVLGDVTQVNASTKLLWPEIEIVDTNTTSIREIPDHLDLMAETKTGSSAVIQVVSGVSPENACFRFEIRGENGWLTLSGNHLAGAQVGDIVLESDIQFAAPEKTVVTSAKVANEADFWDGAAVNIGEVYNSLADDIFEGTYYTTGFDHALHNSHLIKVVEESANTGSIKSVRGLQS